MDEQDNIKMAMLGAARIGRWGIVKPAQEVAGVELYAVAARDHKRARDYAGRYSIPVVHACYEEMLADPAIDAVYNPLPNGLHCEWTIKALDAGKHVLCEKPFASNADQARQMAAAASRNNKVLMEALHYRFHPMAARMQQAVGELGAIRHIETNMCIPLPMMNDIRYDYELGGGAAMDVGAYAVSLMRFLGEASADPLLAVMPEIVAVDVKLRRKNVDRAMKVDVRWSNGTTGRLHFSLMSMALFKMSAKVQGEKGELSVLNPYAPQVFNRFKLRVGSQKTVERIVGDATYTCQLREFVRRIGLDDPAAFDQADAIATMAMIDAIYDKAGLPRRGVAAEPG